MCLPLKKPCLRRLLATLPSSTLTPFPKILLSVLHLSPLSFRPFWEDRHSRPIASGIQRAAPAASFLRLDPKRPGPNLALMFGSLRRAASDRDLTSLGTYALMQDAPDRYAEMIGLAFTPETPQRDTWPSRRMSVPVHL